MSGVAHIEAVKTLIGSAVRLYEGDVPDGAALPYAVLYAGGGVATRSRMTPISDRREVTFQVTSVGKDAEGARSVADRVRNAVLDKRPVIAGRSSNQIRQDVVDEPLRVDRDVTPHLLYVVDVYSFATVPAPI